MRVWKTRTDPVAVGLTVGGVLAALISVAVYALRFYKFPIGDPTAFAAFGDFFGGVVGPIVSIVTLVAVATTFAIQRRELVAARRESMALQRHARRQAQDARRLAFDATFFRMMTLFSSRSSQMDPPTRVMRISQMCLAEGEFHGRPKMAVVDAYMAEHRDYASMLGPYFRTLFHIVRAVHQHPDLTGDSKRRYIAFLRAQLSDDELRLMLANVSCHPEGLQDLKPFVRAYGLFKHGRTLTKPTFFDELLASTDLLFAETPAELS